MTGIFISYRPEHTSVLVGRLHERLAAHFGPGQVFRDVENLDPRDDFGQRLDQVVGSCDALLAIMSDRWLLNRDPVGKRALGVARDWVQREVETAVRRSNVLVVPVLVEGASMPGELEMPYSIRSLSMLRALTLSNAGWDTEVERLIGVLDEVVVPAALPSPPGGELEAPATEPPPPATDSPPRRWFRRR